MAGYDIIDGVRVSGTTFTKDQVLIGRHQGSITVSGCTLVIGGTLQGSLSVEEGGNVLIEGSHQGSTNLSGNSKVEVFGKCQGSTNIGTGSEVIVQPSGRLQGSMNNNGKLIIRGAFGGACNGRGDMHVEGNGYIKQPRIENGVHYYDW
ncbi:MULTISPECIES: hypothetical protein [Pseudomonas]|uniref:hypothetical protein n=1 Tax=Pseudomonas TaxID=286 RepID=UPI0018D9BD02|nr:MULTISPECIES: hypothetical protein [Pseudomonas]MBH3372864.1 hypothetical protein [Pseudomonas juntendi]